MSEKSIRLGKIKFILEKLIYGREVRVSNDNVNVAIHYFERIGSKGFMTTEGGKNNYYRYLNIPIFPTQLDFEEIKEFFNSITGELG